MTSTSTSTSTSTRSTSRQDAIDRRRRARIDGALSSADAAEVTADALAVLTSLARTEVRRTRGPVRPDAEDAAQQAALRLLRTTDGALSLAALTSTSRTARLAARRSAERALRSVIGTAVRSGTVTAGPLAHRGTAALVDHPGDLSHGASESDLVARAIDAADRDDVRLDRDQGRSLALSAAGRIGWRAGKDAARRAGKGHAETQHLAQAAADLHASMTARGDWARIHEATTATAVRLVKVQSLDRLLSSPLRHSANLGRPWDPPACHGEATAGRTLSGILADRETAAAWADRFASTLSALALSGEGRGGAALRSAVLALADRTAAGWAQDARTARQAAQERAQDAAAALVTAQDAAAQEQAHKGQEAKRAAASSRAALADAERRAQDATTLAQVLAHLALSAARRPVTLADLTWAALSAAPDTAARQGASGQARRRAAAGKVPDASRLDTATVLEVLAGTRDTASNLSAALRSAWAQAADAALSGI